MWCDEEMHPRVHFVEADRLSCLLLWRRSHCAEYADRRAHPAV